MFDGFAFLLVVASTVRAQLCSTFSQLQLTHSQQGDKQKRDHCPFVQLQLRNTTVLRAEGQQL